MNVRTTTMRTSILFAALWVFALDIAAPSSLAVERASWKAGLAKTRITPDKPLWMGGFGARTSVSQGTLQELYAKALALDGGSHGPAAVAELERCYRAGARGAGEISDKGLGVINQASKAPDMHLDNPRLDPLYEKCADLHMPINLHVGEPIWFYLPMDEKNDGLMNAYHWRLDDKPNLLPHAEMIKVLEVIPT